MKFNIDQEYCYTCKVQNGKYKNHYYPSTKYNPLGADYDDYKVAFNYLAWFDDSNDYNVDIYDDYYGNLKIDTKCGSIDCKSTQTAL